MGTVMKYNIFKAVSTIMTAGAPIITLACCSSFFVHRSETAISAAGMFSLFIAILFLKDKIAENFKMPSALILSLVGFILIRMIENIIMPIKIVCIVTMITSGIDEITFKQFYKRLSSKLPDSVNEYKKFGFIFTTSKKLEV